MRALVITIIVVLVLLLLGWLRFGTPDGNPTIQVDTAEIEEDAGEVIRQGKAAIDEVREDAEEPEVREKDVEVRVETRETIDPPTEDEEPVEELVAP